MIARKASVTLTDQFITAAHAFRLGHEAEGSQLLRECLDQLEPLLTELPHSEAIIQLLPHMLAAQERHDWLGLADYLEYELKALLS
ncbi:hypothetical protein [Shewanella sp. BJSY2023SW005]|uniref:hypothetical protein n=1 Tax=Shewanella sp. BJSY2023SW005 TaxID=3392043 RepID=UPI0039B370D3